LIEPPRQPYRLSPLLEGGENFSSFQEEYSDKIGGRW